MKRIVAMGTAFVLMLAAGMPVSAAGHNPCVGRMLQSSALCRHGDDCAESGHHLFWHDEGQGCGFWSGAADRICDVWAHCAEAGEYGAACILPAAGSETNPGTAAGEVQESQAQTGNAAWGTGAGTYGYGVGDCYPDCDGNGGYSNAGHHEEQHHTSYRTGTGHHGSGHHGRGHH